MSAEEEKKPKAAKEKAEKEPATKESGANKPVLDPEEIDALMASMAPDEQAEAIFATLAPLAQPKSVKAYNFTGGEDGPAKYPLFVNVQERLSEMLSEQWSDLFKRDISISSKDMKINKYLDIISEEEPRVYFAYSAEGHGRMMVTFETSLIVAYVDAMLGGTGEAYGENCTTLSPVEQRLAMRIASSLEKMLESAWKPVHAIDYELFKIDTDPQFIAVAGSNDSCFSTSFEVALDEKVKAIFSLHYPRSFLEPILEGLRSTVSDDAVAVDEEWQAELDQAMDSVPMEMRVVLGKCTLDIARFLDLSPGDLLPLSKGEQESSVLWVDSVPMFNVMAGSQNGKLAVEIVNEMKHGGAS